MNMMSYKGYAARVEFDDEDGLFVGHIAGIRDVVGFHGDTVAKLRVAFREAVNDYVETCRKASRAPQRWPRPPARASISRRPRRLPRDENRRTASLRRRELEIVT